MLDVRELQEIEPPETPRRLEGAIQNRSTGEKHRVSQNW